MTERTTVRLPEDLLGRARRKAAVEGRTLTALIEEGLRAVMAEKPPAERMKRRLPRISKASGGFRPGVDLNNSADLIEEEDREMLERLRRFE
jgi:hypothetical protein